MLTLRLLLLFVVVGCVYADRGKIQPLQPIKATLVQGVAEPSGLTFCNSTGHLYMICDKSKCHYIYELDANGQVLEQYEFDANLRDIECVACDDVNKRIYIAEEAKHTVHSFRLPVNQGDWDNSGDTPKLYPQGQFYITPGSEDPKSGLEGMTVDTKRNLLYITNEKHPKIFYTVRPDGVVIDEAYPDFDTGDLSGVCYDDALDLIWYVSDQKERLYVADLTGTIVYDYWDLPMENPEGIAIDNTKDPAMLYIATDPSAPSGPSYVPALFFFVKPEIGEGLVFYDPENPPPYPPVACDGCDNVYAAANQLKEEYAAEKRHDKTIMAMSIVLPILGGLVVLAVLIGLIAVFYIKKLEEADFEFHTDSTFQRPWYSRVMRLFQPRSEDTDDLLATDNDDYYN